MRLTQESLDAFKRACPENEKIAAIIRDEALMWVEGPIADVGAGRGDIARHALSSVESVLVDRLDFSAFPIAPKHRRLMKNVFEASTDDLGHPRTLVLSHVLQYLDDAPQRLSALLDRIGAPKLLVVANRNVGALGRLVRWSLSEFQDANPEVDVDAVKSRYELVREWPFTTSIYAADRDELAGRLLHLLDIGDTKEHRDHVASFLTGEGLSTTFTFNEAVQAYERR